VLNQGALSSLDQSTVWVLNSLLDVTPSPFYGTTVPAGYISQPAMKLIQNDAAHALSAGSGVLIADIDNGVDPNHPALAGSLLPGFNFIDNSSDISVFRGIDQSTVWILNQVNDVNRAVTVLNGSTVALVNPSAAAVLNQLPAAFGHGTEVAGILRLVAPQSRILPLKAFKADGTGSMYDVLRALYYAVDQGAQVVNMSFSCDCPSRELAGAIGYATDRGVVLVAAAGNDNALVRLFPAAYTPVVGVAATDLADKRAPFSNYGGAVLVAAPGTGVVSSFPGGKYAAVWGTSFSAPMVAAQAALLLERGVQSAAAIKRIAATAAPIAPQNAGTHIGRGRIDLFESLRSDGTGKTK
jgi:thermitase